MGANGVVMDSSEAKEFWEALTEIKDSVNKQATSMAVFAEHVKNQNGKVKKVEIAIQDIKDDLSPDGYIGKDLKWSRGHIMLALGATGALASLFITIIGYVLINGILG